MQKKGILIADAHIKQRLWTNYPRIQGDSYEALKKVQEAAEGGFVISCGDLFDSNRPSSMDLKVVNEFLKNIETLYYINGNHDPVEPHIISSLGTNVVHLTISPTYIEDVAFYGIDWRNSKEDILYLLKEVRSNMENNTEVHNVLIMHQSLDVFFMYHSITLEEIRQALGHSCDIFIGDIHINKTIHSQEGFCTSPGPLVPQDTQQAKHVQYMTDIRCGYPDGATKGSAYVSNLYVNQIPVEVRKYHHMTSYEDLAEAVKVLTEENPFNLPPVIFVKAPHGYKVPREFVNRDDVIVVADTLPAETRNMAQEAQTTGTLLDAVLEEIAETEPDKAQIMKPLAEKLYNEDLPDEYLLGLLNKWEIVRT